MLLLQIASRDESSALARLRPVATLPRIHKRDRIAR